MHRPNRDADDTRTRRQASAPAGQRQSGGAWLKIHEASGTSLGTGQAVPPRCSDPAALDWRAFEAAVADTRRRRPGAATALRSGGARSRAAPAATRSRTARRSAIRGSLPVPRGRARRCPLCADPRKRRQRRARLRPRAQRARRTRSPPRARSASWRSSSYAPRTPPRRRGGGQGTTTSCETNDGPRQHDRRKGGRGGRRERAIASRAEEPEEERPEEELRRDHKPDASSHQAQ